MKLPEEILNKIIDISYDISKNEIAQNFRKISDKYMGEKRGKSLLNQNNEAIAYSIARMPATYAAVSSATYQLIETLKFYEDSEMISRIKTLIDVGAGTGAATLAIAEQLKTTGIELENITCLEREEAMIKLGKTLLNESNLKTVKNASWSKFDINTFSGNERNQFTNNKSREIGKRNNSGCENNLNNNNAHSNDNISRNNEYSNDNTNLFIKNKCDNDISFNADIVVTSYMLNEFAEETVLTVVDKLWSMTEKLLIIVDPGTPKDYERIIRIKDYLAEKGAEIIAPCTCPKGCPSPETDWCNFTCRVERTKIQKDVKGGEVPYEDEKFTYLIVAKPSLNSEKNKLNSRLSSKLKLELKLSRIIRHPIIRSNMVQVKLCSNGQIISKTYTKKDKDLYKKVKKAKVGDIIEE